MHFGWIIAVYLFLAGAGAGAFITGILARRLDRDGRLSAVTRAGTLLAAPLATVGILFLVLDLGWVEAGKFEPWRILYLYTNPSSMITWGTWILTFFIPLSLLYGLAQTGLVFPGKTFFSSRLAGCLSTIFAFGTAVYTGILLGVVKAVPLWNNSVLPLLFLISALSTGLAAALIGATLMDKAVSARLHVFKPVHIILVSSELLLIFVLLFISAKSSQVAGASVEMLVSGAYSRLFWLGVIVAGLALPLALQFLPAATPPAKTARRSDEGHHLAVGKSALTVQEAAHSGKGLIILEGVLVLTGGFILRFLILAAGLPVNLF